MHIQQWPVGSLVPHSRQLRRNHHAVQRMAASIHEFGFKIPVLARSGGEVVDGHLRLKAAQKLGLSEVPVILCDEWTRGSVDSGRPPGALRRRHLAGGRRPDLRPEHPGPHGHRPALWSPLRSGLAGACRTRVTASNRNRAQRSSSRLDRRPPVVPWRCSLRLARRHPCRRGRPQSGDLRLPHPRADYPGQAALRARTGDYPWQHEPCWYAVREGQSSRWNGDRTQATRWEVANLNPFGGAKPPAATAPRSRWN